ncbi:MAG: hypothetical protein ACTTH5_02775 [Wolinella sp.]
MSLSVEFIQRASEEIAKAKEFQMSDFADQMLQSIRMINLLDEDEEEKVAPPPLLPFQHDIW